MKGTVLFRQVTNGDFKLLDPYEVLDELKLLLETLDNDNLLINSTHGSNLLAIKGTLGEVKLSTLDHINRRLLTKDNDLIGKAYLGHF